MKTVLLFAALLLPPMLAAYAGARGPVSLRLNLGPGNGPYVSGFPASYDVAGGTALQWSGPFARIDLPLRYTGPAELVMRFGPPRGEGARVDIAVDGRPLEPFACCDRQAFQRRRVGVFDGTSTPVSLSIRVSRPEAEETSKRIEEPPDQKTAAADASPTAAVSSPTAEEQPAIPSAAANPSADAGPPSANEPEELGLLLDWVTLEVGEGGRVVLSGLARWRAAALVAVAFVLLLIYGMEPVIAALACAPLSLVLAGGLVRDPWLIHRILTLLPESLLVFGLVAVALAWSLENAGLLGRPASDWAATLAVLVFLVRAAALNHPDYYYPDLMSHARRTAVVQRAGLDAFLSPASYLDARAPKEEGRTAAGLWLYRIGEKHFPLPYSLLPYVPLAIFRLDYDTTITALKLYGAACSALAVVLVAALARALGAPFFAALLAAAAPTAVAELTMASMPALVGHVFDLALLVFLAARVDEMERPRVLALGVVLLTAAQLAYISSTVTTTVLLACLILITLAGRGPQARERARALAKALVLGCALSALLYYRDFIAGTFEAVMAAFASSESARPARPGPGRIEASLTAWAFPLVLVLALVGLAGFLRDRERPSGRAVLAACVLTVGLVGVLRLRVPVVFGHVHLALFVTPLLCVAAGAGLGFVAEKGRVARVASVALLVVLMAQGLWLQAQLFANQLGRAR